MLYDAGLGGGFGPRELDILSYAAHTGRCPVRIAGALSANNQALLDTWLQAYQPGYGDALFSVQAMKLVADGSNQGLTGFQTVPYAYHDPQLPIRGGKGLFNFASLDYPALVKRIVDAGWPVLIHANGDAAIHLTLEAYRSALHGTSGLAKRHRIEHCSVLDAAHLHALQELGISPSFLIGHIGYWGAAFNQTILGEDRARLVDRCASAARAGLRFSLHTDHFVTPLGPLRLMEQAIARRMEGAPGQETLNPDECLTPAQALKAVTYDAAWQCHMDAVGSLEPGKWADFAILDADPLNPPAHLALRDISVYQTWLGGQVKYAAHHGRSSRQGHLQKGGQ
jgi:hypothetical protein